MNYIPGAPFVLVAEGVTRRSTAAINLDLFRARAFGEVGAAPRQVKTRGTGTDLGWQGFESQVEGSRCKPFYQTGIRV